MPVLRFPSDRVVGTLEWIGSWHGSAGPVLATGDVLVPDGAEVELRVDAVTGSRPAGRGTWQLLRSTTPVDLGFLRDLRPDVVRSVTISSATEESIEALPHLAPALRQLVLADTGFSDAVLPSVAAVSHLTDLQTWGNRFTDDGVQVLGALSRLERLSLEEASLTVAAFDFVDGLPCLVDLDLQDVPLSAQDVADLRRRLPGVRVGG